MSELVRIAHLKATAKKCDYPGALEDLKCAIENGTSPEDYNQIVLTGLRAKMGLGIGKGSGPNRHAKTPDTSVSDVLGASMLLLDQQDTLAEERYGEVVCERAKDLRSSCWLDVCAAASQLRGKPRPSDDGQMVEAAFSSADLSVALGSNASLLMNHSFEQSPQTYRPWVAVKSLKDFKEHTSVQSVLSTGSFEPVGNGGEVEVGSLAERTITHQIAPRARLLTISRQDVFNDELGIVHTYASALGREVVRNISTSVYDRVRDGSAFFTTGSANKLSGAGSALDADSLGEASELFRNRIDVHGNVVDIGPKFLIVPSALESLAKQTLRAVELVTQRDASLTLLVESRLGAGFTGGSDVSWFLASSRSTASGIFLSLLDGVERPTIDVGQPDDYANMGLAIRGDLAWGVNFGDFRALQLNVGT